MRAKTEIRLTPGQRLSRGLKYSAVGPVDVTRGAVGLGVDGAQSSAAWVGDLYRRSRLKDQLGKELAAAQDTIASELAAAQEVVANLPQAVAKGAHPSAQASAAAGRARRGGAGRGSGGILDHPAASAAGAADHPAAERAGIAAAVRASKLEGMQCDFAVDRLHKFGRRGESVEPRGFEPLTSALQRQRSTN